MRGGRRPAGRRRRPEGDIGVVGGDHAGQQREGAVFEFHHHALDGLLGLGQVEQLEDDRLVFAEHFAGGDAEQQAITDLAGGAGDGNAHGALDMSLLNETAWLGCSVELGRPAETAELARGGRGDAEW